MTGHRSMLVALAFAAATVTTAAAAEGGDGSRSGGLRVAGQALRRCTSTGRGAARAAIVTSGDGGWVHLGPGRRRGSWPRRATSSSASTRRPTCPASPAGRRRSRRPTCRADYAVLVDYAAQGAPGPPLLVRRLRGRRPLRARGDRARGPAPDRRRRGARAARQERARLALARLDDLHHEEDAERAAVQRARVRGSRGAGPARARPLDARRVRARRPRRESDRGAGAGAASGCGRIDGGGPPLQRQAARAAARAEGGDRVDRQREGRLALSRLAPAARGRPCSSAALAVLHRAAARRALRTRSRRCRRAAARARAARARADGRQLRRAHRLRPAGLRLDAARPAPRLGRARRASSATRSATASASACSPARAVRFRFYTRWGVGAADLSRIVLFQSTTFWLGLLVLGGCDDRRSAPHAVAARAARRRRCCAPAAS